MLTTKANKAKPARVLHVLGSLGMGGIETWLMNVFRNSDRSKIQHEVFLTKSEEGAYEAEARSLGVKVFRPKQSARKVQILVRLNRHLAANDYAVVHSHVYLFSGLVAVLGAARRIPVRISHCHHAELTQSHSISKNKRNPKVSVLQYLNNMFATHLIGISSAAIAELAGDAWKRNKKASILLYGFDFSPFSGAGERAHNLRKSLGLEPDSLIIGHVGRFVWEKNHDLLLQAFAKFARTRPHARLVLVGDGPLRPSLEQDAASLGVRDQVTFVPSTRDVPAFMAMFDVFVLPSITEGLGIVALEAQAAGLDMIISNVVPSEVDIIPDLIVRIPPNISPEDLVETLLVKAGGKSPRMSDAWTRMNKSPFSLRKNLENLEAIYGV